jgi:hypothetical protein
MDKIPLEICTEICAYACLDSGRTGRTLSLVSKYVHGASQPVKLQSISLHGKRQIAKFASLLRRTPSHLRRVRYLFLSRHDPYPLDALASKTGYNLDVEIEHEKRFFRVILSILTAVSETVEVLEVVWFSNFDANLDATHLISLPRLKEITTHHGFALDPIIFESCPQLRWMHIVKPYRSDLFGAIRAIAPSLTHLRFSRLQRQYYITLLLEVAMGIREAPPDAKLKLKLPITTLPSSVQTIIAKPSRPPAPTGYCGTHAAEYHDLMGHLNRLNEEEDRFVLLKAQDDPVPSDSDWLERIVGRNGHWSFDLSDVVPKTGIVAAEEEW